MGGGGRRGSVRHDRITRLDRGRKRSVVTERYRGEAIPSMPWLGYFETATRFVQSQTRYHNLSTTLHHHDTHDTTQLTAATTPYVADSQIPSTAVHGIDRTTVNTEQAGTRHPPHRPRHDKHTAHVNCRRNPSQHGWHLNPTPTLGIVSITAPSRCTAER